MSSIQGTSYSSIAIVDGPGLAHYVYYGLCRERGDSVETITYADIATAVIAWLHTTQSVGLTIGAVVFDGALPEPKKETRISRLQRYAERVHTYKQATRSARAVFDGAARNALPPPPFLVPSVVEELLDHKQFGDITLVVPGEADPYCVAAALHLSQTSPTDMIAIFSDDSDLLVYRLSDQICVAPFRDLCDEKNGANITRKAEIYWPAQIAKQALLNDLIKPAFFMSLDPHLTFDKAAQKTRNSDPSHSKDFQEFDKTFQTSMEQAQWTELTSPLKRHTLASYDTRVSELVCQLPSLDSQDSQCLRMYLPFLIDDPGRATGWKVGSMSRTAAYEILLRCTGLKAHIQEYGRSGSKVASLLIESRDAGDTSEQLKEWIDHLEAVLRWAVQSQADELSGIGIWRYLALRETLEQYHSDRGSLPTLNDALHVVRNREDRNWARVHLTAQYQAAYYSMRMLKQIISYVAVLPQNNFQEQCLRLCTLLSSLPTIAKFFGAFPKWSEDNWEEIVTELLESLDVEQDEEGEEDEDQDEEMGGIDDGAATAGNPFSLVMR